MRLKRRGQRSLNQQLLLLGALPAALMFIGLMTFFTTARLSDAREELFSATQSMADNLAPAVEYAVVSGNTRVLQQILAQSMSNSPAEWIRVTDVIGNQVGYVSQNQDDDSADAGARNDLHLFESDILQQPVELGQDDRVQWFEPDYRLGSGAIRLGTVEVAVSERQLSAAREDILITSSVVGISLLVFALLLVNRMLGAVTEPMRVLSDRVRHLINRDYQDSDLLSRSSVAEIAELEENLNELGRHLRQLKQSRDHTLELSESARERAETANRAKSEFLAVMSHELRTPLNGVLGMVELVAEDPLTQRQSDYLATARRSTEDLLTVINDILDFSRLDRGRLILEENEFDARSLIENCIASHRHAANRKGLGLESSFVGEWPARPLLRGDAVRFRQILASLLDNAIKFSNEGSIRVVASWHTEVGDCVYLGCEVMDRGDGIPSEHRASIFNTFEQLDSSNSRAHSGTGIGLALVQRLVELLGGHIRLDSRVGSGSSFHFEVPFDLVPASESLPAPETLTPETPRPLNGRTPRALVVEDNLVNQRVAKALLDRLGFNTDAVGNGQEAVDRFDQGSQSYSVILMDCQMPVMDGYEATLAIRELERERKLKPTPIIALTADALTHTEAACLDVGMSDYLAKPVRKANLRTVLSRWVNL